MGFTKGSFTWCLVVVMCMNVAYTNAWGTYVCDLKEQGLQRIGEICSGSATSLQSPFTALEDKLDRVLDFMEEIKKTEDSWLFTAKKSGTVERDISRHEDTVDEAKKDEQVDDEDEDDVRDRDQSRQEAINDNRNRSGEDERTEIEEDDHTQDRRDQSSRGGEWTISTRGYDRESRGDRTNRYDWRNRRDERGEDRRQRTDEDETEDKRDRTTGDHDRRESDDAEDRRKKVDKEEETGPKKGECTAIVMNSHETIGMFYMMSYQHGHCANRNPINEPIRYCLGYCTTKTFIEREAGIWSQGNDCKSCQPQGLETLRIPLSCDDGFTFEKKFSNVVDCSCRDCLAVDNGRRP